MAIVKVGFVGVGRMGRVMVQSLLNAGHQVRAWDVTPEAVAEVAKHGAEKATNAKEAFSGDAVISMLPNDDAMRGMFLSSDFLQAAGKPPVHINMATASVQCANELAEAHGKNGVQYIAAPVFGRPEMAAERNLNIMAAGDSATIDRVQPLFDALGKKTWRVGPVPSQANVVKLAGNLMVAAMIEAMAETAALGKGYDIDPSTSLEIIVKSLFDVPIYRIYAGLVANGPYEPPGFDLKLALKDIKLMLAAGEQADVPLPVVSVIRDNYLDAIAHGDGAKDWSVSARVALRRAGLD
jgi:3-hydroxyisobutyrate dehydrogenase-like beta-hydroxyacid dehydrogenase